MHTAAYASLATAILMPAENARVFGEKVNTLSTRCIANRKQNRIHLDTVGVSEVFTHTNLTCENRRALAVERVDKIAGL